MQKIAESEDIEFNKLRARAAEVCGNMFVETANEAGIKRFEKLFGVTPNNGQSLSERRTCILFAMNKRKISLSEITAMLTNYAEGIRLIPDYNNSDLTVWVDEYITILKTIYNILDEFLPLQVRIGFQTEITAFIKFVETTMCLELKADLTFFETWEAELGLKTEIRTKEEFRDTILTESKDLWTLDGQILLDGSRLLDAERKEGAF